MKESFLRIKALGIVSDAWLINNRGDVIHQQISGAINKKMLADISQRILQLLVLQSSYIGPDPIYVLLSAEEMTIVGFDLGPLVLVTVASNAVEPDRVLEELRPIAEDMRTDHRLTGKYARKGIERRDQISDGRMDDKARNLLLELRKNTF